MCFGVGKMAGTVNTDYLRSERKADIELNGHDRDSPLDGPEEAQGVREGDGLRRGPAGRDV